MERWAEMKLANRSDLAACSNTLRLGRECGIIPPSTSNNAIGIALSWGVNQRVSYEYKN